MISLMTMSSIGAFCRPLSMSTVFVRASAHRLFPQSTNPISSGRRIFLVSKRPTVLIRISAVLDYQHYRRSKVRKAHPYVDCVIEEETKGQTSQSHQLC